MTIRGVWAMGWVLVLLVLGLSACTSGTTPAGPLGNSVDLRSLLPADVRSRAPADADMGRYQTADATVQVGNPAATVRVTWKYFQDGQRSYLLSVAFRVIEPAAGLELSVSTNNVPVYIGSNERAVEALRVGIRWSRQSPIGGGTFDTVNGLILANGTWQSQ